MNVQKLNMNNWSDMATHRLVRQESGNFSTLIPIEERTN